MGSVDALPHGVNLAEKSCVTRSTFGSNADDLNRAERLASHVEKAGVGGTRMPHVYCQARWESTCPMWIGPSFQVGLPVGSW